MIRSTGVSLAIVAWLLCAEASARAQSAGTVQPGQTVRIQLRDPAARLVGRAVRLDGDTVVLAITHRHRDVTFAVPRAAVSQVWVSRRESRSVGRGILIGTSVGMATGAAIGAIGYKPCHSEQFLGCILDLGRGGTALLGGLVGGVLGLGVGAFAGAATVRHQWEPVPAPAVTVAPGGDRRIGLALRVPL